MRNRWWMMMVWGLWLAVPAWAAEPAPAVPGELLTTDEALGHLASTQSSDRERGLYQLGMLKDKAQLPKVTEALADNHPDVRRAAVVALRLIEGPAAVEQLQALATSSRRVDVREQALHELEALGAEAKPAVPSMVKAAKRRRQPEVRLAALEAMGATGDVATIPSLLKALKSRDERTRRAAAIALGRLGPDAQPAVPALIKRLRNDADENVRVDAAEALRRIGDQRAISPLLKALNDPADRVRVPAIEALEGWAQPGMESLIAPYLERGRPHVRIYATRILVRIGTAPALELLKARLARETHERVRPALEGAVRDFRVH